MSEFNSKKISELTGTTSVSSDDLFVLVQENETKKIKYTSLSGELLRDLKPEILANALSIIADDTEITNPKYADCKDQTYSAEAIYALSQRQYATNSKVDSKLDTQTTTLQKVKSSVDFTNTKGVYCDVPDNYDERNAINYKFFRDHIIRPYYNTGIIDLATDSSSTLNNGKEITQTISIPLNVRDIKFVLKPCSGHSRNDDHWDAKNILKFSYQYTKNNNTQTETVVYPKTSKSFLTPILIYDFPNDNERASEKITISIKYSNISFVGNGFYWECHGYHTNSDDLMGGTTTTIGGYGGGVIDGTLLREETIRDASGKAKDDYLVWNDCMLAILLKEATGGKVVTITANDEIVYRGQTTNDTGVEYFSRTIPVKKGSRIQVFETDGNLQSVKFSENCEIIYKEFKLNSLTPQIAMPNYDADAITDIPNGWTVIQNGWIRVNGWNTAKHNSEFCINGKQISWSYTIKSGSDNDERETAGQGLFPVSKGDIITYTGTCWSFAFYPCKTSPLCDDSYSKIIYSIDENPTENLSANTLYVCGVLLSDNRYTVLSSQFIMDKGYYEFKTSGLTSITLQEGNYHIACVGGGGKGVQENLRYSTGGSGACFIGQMHLTADTTLNIYVGGTAEDTYIQINKKILTVDHGTNGYADYWGGTAGQGGKEENCIFDNTIISKTIIHNGNNGVCEDWGFGRNGGDFAYKYYPYGGGGPSGDGTLYYPQTGYVRITRI